MDGSVVTHLHEDILSLIERQSNSCADAIAIEDAGELKLSYRALGEKVARMNRALSGFGVERGARVAIVLPNGAEMATTLLGVSATAIAVPLNPAYRADEFRAYFQEVGVGFLIAAEGDAPVARAVAEEAGVVVLDLAADGSVSLADTEEDNGNSPGQAFSRPDPDDVAMILLTSGSTGKSKKVPLTHRNMCVSVSDVCRSLSLAPEDRCLCMWEQFHIGGLTDLLLVPLAAGSTVICTAGFDAEEFYRLLEAKKPTWFQGVPTALHELVFYAGKNGVATQPNSLRLIRSVAAALAPSLMAEVEELFGAPVIQTFGMTEAGPLIASTLPPPAERKPGSVGPSAGPEIRIMGDDGAALAQGEVGEIAVRGANVVSGYEDDAEATAHSFRDGWFLTGDTGFLDEDGHLFLKGRLKQMINRGGEKVNPQELDDVLLTHPAVEEVAAFPVKHRTLGEDVGVAVVLKSSSGDVTESELRAYVAERLAPFKVPQMVQFVGRIPRNAVGKIHRPSLTAMAEAKSQVTADTGAVSKLEEQIAKIWAGELNLPSVGPDDNFFAIGGESLSGVRVFLEVEKAFGKPLPDSALTGITTVREMARLIDASEGSLAQDTEDHDPDSLTETEKRSISAVMGMGGIPVARPGSIFKAVNLDGKRTPVFWCFNSPAKEMGGLVPHLNPDQPLYGVYSGGWLFPKTPEMYAKITRYYSEQISAEAPDGPLVIGGNCGGSRLALQIAKRLIESGRDVRKICLLEHSRDILEDDAGQALLHELEIPVLLLYGKQSKLTAYRAMRWQMPGWRKPFRRVPTVEWVSGSSGRYFRPHNVSSVAGVLERFLQTPPVPPGLAVRIEAALVMAVHKVPPLFYLYKRIFRMRDKMILGKIVKTNPFTGEPLT